MSTAKFDTLSTLDGSRSVPVNTVAQGSAKAWVNFNGTGTVAIRASFNVSSITDDATGNYTVNLTTAMPDTNYATVVTAGNSVGDGTGNAIYALGNAITTSTVNVHTRNANNSDADYPSVSVSIFR
jgi:hypothetical protein